VNSVDESERLDKTSQQTAMLGMGGWNLKSHLLFTILLLFQGLVQKIATFFMTGI
jgi:hypothetical protein